MPIAILAGGTAPQTWVGHQASVGAAAVSGEFHLMRYWVGSQATIGIGVELPGWIGDQMWSGSFSVIGFEAVSGVFDGEHMAFGRTGISVVGRTVTQTQSGRGRTAMMVGSGRVRTGES